MRYWKPKAIDPSFKLCVSIVTYNQSHCLASLIHALRAQTFNNFTAYVIHDGPWTSSALTNYCYSTMDDTRFVRMNTDTRSAKFGHNLRQIGFDRGISEGCNWICTMNADCWYSPNYFEWMLGAATDQNANFVYCNLVHSHKLWKPMKSELKRGSIDAGSWIAHTSLVGNTKWDSSDFAADWKYINILKDKPNFKPAKVDGYIYVHN